MTETPLGVMRSEVDLGAPAIDVADVPPPPGTPPKKIIGRSPGQLAWMRLRRDRRDSPRPG